MGTLQILLVTLLLVTGRAVAEEYASQDEVKNLDLEAQEENVEKSHEEADQENTDIEAKAECALQTPHPTGSPCANGYIQWNDPQVGSYVPGHDITSKGGMTAATCQELCWTYPGCVSIDITKGGICYLNYKNVALAKSPDFTFIDFSCCKPSGNFQCEKKVSAANNTGPCYGNTAKFIDYVPGKYVPGYDIKVLYKQTVDTCRQACWDTPFCQSADITRDGVCYLNSIKGPAKGESTTFSFIDFECCPAPEPECLKTEEVPTGGPCFNDYVKWANPQMGTCQPGNDIASKGGLNVDTCRAFCHSYPGCVSADLYRDGTCYANFKKDSVKVCEGFMYLDFECCSNTSNSQCAAKQPVPTGSPCPSGSIKWKDSQPTKYVPGNDLISKPKMTVKSCQEFCWSYPGCVSADIAYNGDCYLNAAASPVGTSHIFSLLEYECCNPKPQPVCERRPSKAGGSGPCYSGRAKFFDYQPGKYVAGYDIKVENGHNISSCQQLCWDTAGCQSADLTNAGVCYLNSVRAPLSNSGFFSFIDFECCEGGESACVQTEEVPTGGPCPNNYVRWAHPVRGSCQPGNDIAAKGGMTIESCRSFCLSYPGCVSADLFRDGTCYANFKKDTVRTCEGFTYLDFECCSNISNSQCATKEPVPTGSPCPSGSIKWKDSQPTKYVPGNDITSKPKMTIKSCQEFCWSYPGCVSADIAYNGDCYLNSAAGPVGTSTIFSLLEYECCNPKPAPVCERHPSKAGGSGPCYNNRAKHLDYQPGKYVAGYDIKVENGHNISSCRQLCWDTAGCRSADLTNTGTCYLNNVRAPLSSSPLFSFIDFECCEGDASVCEFSKVSPTGGPCPNGYVQWTTPRRGFCQPGNDITSKAGMTMESCRDLCLTYPGCTGVDITSAGVCYINYKKEPMQPCNDFTNSNLDCCSNVTTSQCVAKEPSPTGSPCASGSIEWKDFKPTKYVPGHDIISKSQMTIKSCQEFCWTYPGCVSADITYNGDCYLNYATGPVGESTLFSLLDFECCNPKPLPLCTKYESKAGDKGPCPTGIARFLDYQPGNLVAGFDIKVETGHNISSCRQLCWDTPNCKSADLTQAGVCYLNSVRAPVTKSHLFSFIDFECCNAEESKSTVAPVTVPACTKETKVDITFVLDCSGSIGENNFFKGLIPAVQGIIDLMIPGDGNQATNTRVACVSYSNTAILEWDFNKYPTKNELVAAVGKVPFYASTTATGDALNMVLTQVHPTVRTGVKHLVILITDGVQNDGKYKDSEEAEKLKKAGANVFVIGVGDEIDKPTLDKLASGPEYRADVKNYADLKDKMQALAYVTCKQAN